MLIMKKFFKRTFFIILLFIIIYIIYLHTLYDYNFYSSLIETPIPMFAKMEEKDTHGGFHGDGETLVKIYFSNKQAERFVSKIENNTHWNKSPIDETLMPCITNNSIEDMSIPFVEKGYWFFLDRYSKATNKYNYNDMLNRASSNYSIAIFDREFNILYIYSLDT